MPAALTGAVLLQAADLTAQVSLPVGVVTTVIGGGYLLVRRAGRPEIRWRGGIAVG